MEAASTWRALVVSHDLTIVGEKLFFTASDADHGTELWVNDATTGETRLVADLEPGEQGILIRDSIVPFGGGIFFWRDDIPADWDIPQVDKDTFSLPEILKTNAGFHPTRPRCRAASS